MKALGICSEGFEKAAAIEINEITGKETVEELGGVSFEAENNEEIAELCYRAQSLHKVMLVLGEFNTDNLEDNLGEKIKKTDFGSWLNGTFRVNVYHEKELDVSGMDLAAKAGEFIINKTNAKADMENPKVIVLVYIHGQKGYFGIDFAGITLSKRDYKIYNVPSSLNASTAYCLLRMAGWAPGKIVLDPMCGSGIIPIEAGLSYAKKPPHFHIKDKLAFTRFMDFDFSAVDKEAVENDKKIGREAKLHCADHLLAALRATKNNAKIADIDRIISATKIDLEWLETKYDEKFFDFIITHPPSISKYSNVKELEKMYNEFFYQAEYILKDDGIVAVLANSSDGFLKACENNKFQMISENQVWQGKHKFSLMIFKKQNSD